jgi:hypothetical protein
LGTPQIEVEVDVLFGTLFQAQGQIILLLFDPYCQLKGINNDPS